MDSYKVNKQDDVHIILGNEQGIVEPMGSGCKFEVHEEMDPLFKIIKDINERFGTAFTSDDKVILNNLSRKLMQNRVLEGSIKNNNKDAAKIKFNELFQDELLSMVTSHFDLYKRLDSRPELKTYVNDRIFDFVSKKMSGNYLS